MSVPSKATTPAPEGIGHPTSRRSERFRTGRRRGTPEHGSQARRSEVTVGVELTLTCKRYRIRVFMDGIENRVP